MNMQPDHGRERIKFLKQHRELLHSVWEPSVGDWYMMDNIICPCFIQNVSWAISVEKNKHKTTPLLYEHQHRAILRKLGYDIEMLSWNIENGKTQYNKLDIIKGTIQMTFGASENDYSKTCTIEQCYDKAIVWALQNKEK